MKRIFAIVIVAVFLIGIGSAAAGNAGTPADPVASKSYVEQTLAPSLLQKAGDAVSGSFAAVYNAASLKLDAVAGYFSGDYSFAGDFTGISAAEGNTLVLRTGASAMLTSGTARLTVSMGTVINVTKGSVVASGSVLQLNQRYMAAEETVATVTVFSSDAEILVDGYYIFDSSAVLPPGSFLDVPDTHWAYDYISMMAVNGYLSGVGDRIFLPDKEITRAEFVTILAVISKIDKNNYAAVRFSDVSANAWYAPYVEWAAQLGIVSSASTAFYPNRSITREEMAVVLKNFSGFAGYAMTAINTEKSFSDGSSISSWAKDSVSLCQQAGIINGYPDGTFRPKASATRATASTMIYMLITD